MADWNRSTSEVSGACDRVCIAFLYLLVSHIFARRQGHLLLEWDDYRLIAYHTTGVCCTVRGCVLHVSLPIGTDDHGYMICTGTLL